MADEPRLSERAEQLLASFPVPERDWDAQARAIEARLATTALGSTEARWLEAPLGDEAPEPLVASANSPSAALEAPAQSPTETPFPFESMPSIIEAPPSAPEQPAAAAGSAAPAATATPLPSSGNSQSLSALARSVAQKGGRAQSRDIARESLSVAAAARSHNDAMAERVRSARPVPPPPSQRPAPPSERPAPPSRRAAQSAPPAPANNNAQLGPWIAVGGIGIAAAIALWAMRPAAPAAPQASLERPAVVAPLPVAQVAEAPPAPKPLAPEEREEATTQAPPPAGAGTPSVAASALPLAPRLAAAAAPVRAGGDAPAAPVAAAPVASVATAERPAPESIVLEDTPTPGKAGAKGGAAAPAGANSALRPAAGSPAGGLPDRPSTGAVQAAVGSVMGAARACVAGGVATPAQVTFGSSGTVQAVTVSGPNAGTASASCIDAALRRARVAPFTSPTFSLMVWVRP